MRGWRRWLLLVSGLVPLLALTDSPPDPTLLIYSLFVLVWLALPQRQPPSTGRFVITMVAAGLVTECLAWLNNFLECNPEPALLHPQLLPDLTLALVFYGSWAAAWLLLLRRYTFTPAQIFITQGLFGVLLEQRGAIFVLGLTTMPLGLIFWLYVFLVYGSVVGIAARIGGLPGEGTRVPRWRFPLAMLAVAAVMWPLVFVWGGLTQAVGLIPDPAPICERPLF